MNQLKQRNGRISLLYTEDDPVTRKSFSTFILNNFPELDLLVAENGSLGLEMFKDNNPDIVLTGIKMPVRDSVRMAREIKATNPDTIIIFVSAYSDLPHLLDAIEIGVNHLLIKPVVHQKLFAAIEKSIAKANLQRRVREQESEILRLSTFPHLNPNPILELDEDGNMTFCNLAAEKIIGKEECSDSGNPFVPTDLPEILREMQEKKVLLHVREIEFGGKFFREYIHRVAQFNTVRIFAIEFTGLKQANEALEAANERLRLTLESITDAYIAIDPQWRFLAINPVAERMIFKRPVAELIGKVYWEEFPKSAQTEFYRQYQIAVSENRPVYFEAYSLIGGKWLETHVYPRLGLLEVYFRDITERKLAEEKLRKSEQMLADAQRIAHIGNWELDITTDTITCSKELCRIFSIESELHHLSYESFLEQVNPDDRESTDKAIEKAFNDFRPFDFHFRINMSDGSVRTLHSLGKVIADDAGKPAMMIGTNQDVTEIKQTEEALQVSEKKFSTIFQSAPAMICITTLVDGRFIDANKSFLQTMGYQREEVIGRTSWELIWGSPAERGRIIETLLAQGTLQDLEINFKCRSERIIVGLLSAEIIDFYGEQYVLSLVKDITERKRMEEKIEALNTDLAAQAARLAAVNIELEAFNYTVSHDLRRPLTTISACCQVIVEQCGHRLDEQCTEYLQHIYDGTLDMSKLIDVLLKFSRLSHAEIKRETVDLSLLAKIVVTELRTSELQRQVTCTITEGMKVRGDKELLRVVLGNLIGNAWKYTAKKEEACIEFEMTTVAGEAAFFVRDNGQGFDPAHAAKLFVPFQRLPGTDEYKGHGIGLATVQRIIGRHGGRVWAEGEVGKGATFYFTLG